MDLSPTPEQLALRHEIQDWLAANLEPRVEGREWQRRLAAGGWGAPAWPPEHGGRGFGPIEMAIFNDEMARSGVPSAAARIGTGWAGPAIIAHGADEQKRRFLPSILNGEEIWCQLFSEPNAGSDLAGLSTRAELRGDRWIVNGQKIWTSLAQEADYGILLARTDPKSQRRTGITFFAFPMHQPGVEIRPIRQMDGKATFNEVFFTDAQIADGHVIGQVGEGWQVAITTLMNERRHRRSPEEHPRPAPLSLPRDR
jgi:alkylation response protein AidB-like acyl-CoA dehydrogenase